MPLYTPFKRKSSSWQEEQVQALDQLVRDAIAYRTGPELKELFDFNARFPHIAPYNVMLLHIQNRGICYALPAHKWRDEYGRRLKPDARPYVILRFMGPVDFVFDLSDTEPIDANIKRIPERAENPFPTKGEPSIQMLQNLMAACRKASIEVSTQDHATNLAGYVRHTGDRIRDYHISLNSKHTTAQQFATLAHELAHVLCGHLGPGALELWPERGNLKTPQKEFEAEGVAYLYALRQGVALASAGYLSGYLSGEGEAPSYSLETILTATAKLEEMASGKFRVRKRKK